jgi:adenine-specific DNA-methyltransferase
MDFKVDMKSQLSFLKELGGGIERHCGNENKDYDFIMKDSSSLSIKTNISTDKVCPQNLGQTSLKKINPEFVTSSDYKQWVLSFPEEAYDIYIKNMFICDHTVYINFKSGEIYYIKKQELQIFEKSRYTFTRDITNWNESCSMKLDGKTIAEFQVHNSRSIVKCRFSMTNLMKFLFHTKIPIPPINFKVCKTLGTFNYLGSKTKLLDFIKDTIEDYTRKPLKEIESFYDLFAGTGVVSSMLLENGCKKIVTNDNMYYSYVLCSSLNQTTPVPDIFGSVVLEEGYIHDTYAKNRMYFTKENAIIIDSMRKRIEDARHSLTNSEYMFLLKTLLYASSKVANISSTFGAFLKKYKKSAMCQLKLKPVYNSYDAEIENYNTNVLDFVVQQGDVCYIDPPYNSRKYSSNYFVMEAIAKYTCDPVSDSVTGVPLQEPEGSDSFCSKSKVLESFKTIFTNIHTNYIFMSYNSEGILSREQIEYLLLECGWKRVEVKQKEYKRFKSNNNTTTEGILYEYIFCASRI